MHADEILRRRDVVVNERHPVGQREGGARRLGAERKMMEQQVVGMAEIDQLAIVARQRLEPVVRGLDEDLRLVAGAPQHALDAEHFVADRVAVAERREDLVDRASRASPDVARRLDAGPTGSFGEHLVGRRQVLTPPVEPAGQRVDPRCGRRLLLQAARTCRGTCARSPASRSARGKTAGRSGRAPPLSHRFCSIARSVSTNSGSVS